MIGDCICHLVSSQYGGKCHIASGQGLADAHDVRFHPGPFPGEKPPGPSESRCDFIKDQQYLIPITQFTCRYQECG